MATHDITPERAREILGAIHRGADTIDASEAEAACALLESDTGLQEWFAGSCSDHSALDEAIAAKLESLPIPDDLRERAGSMDPVDDDQSPSPAATMVRLMTPALAAAALFVAALFIFRPGQDEEAKPIAVQQSGGSVNALREDMAAFAMNLPGLQHTGAELPELAEWLARNDSPLGDLESTVGRHPALGCSLVKWGSANVSLICFKRDNGDVVHLFAANLSDVQPGSAPIALDSAKAANGLQTATWSSGENLYVLVGATPEVEVDSLL